jgi:hypothetical protein
MKKLKNYYNTLVISLMGSGAFTNILVARKHRMAWRMGLGAICVVLIVAGIAWLLTVRGSEPKNGDSK